MRTFILAMLDVNPKAGYKKEMPKLFRTLLLSGALITLVACSALPTPMAGQPAVATQPAGTTAPIDVANSSETQTPAGPTATPLPPTEPIPTTIPVDGSPIDELILNGEYDQVRSLIGNEPPSLKNTWLLAKTEFLAENYTGALEHFRNITSEAPDSPEATRSWFMLAEVYYNLGRYAEAIPAYLEYQKRSPLLTNYILGKLGNSYSLNGQYDEAIATYNKLLENLPNDEATRIKIGRAYLFGGKSAEALKTFDEISSTTEDDYTKAQMDLLAGQAYINQGDNDKAYERWQHAVDNYPLSYDAFSALQGLVTYEQKVDLLQQGFVYYYAGDQAGSIKSFSDYISQNPQHDGTALFYLGMLYRDSGDYPAAVKAFDTLIEKYPQNQHFNAAWDERATTLWAYMDEHEKAAASLESFANTYPANNIAATYLLEAGRIRERAKQLEHAARVWESLPIQFPDSAERFTALMYAGIARYRLKQYDRAKEDFEQALQISKDDEQIVRANFWLGKTAKATGKEVDANTAWQKVMEMDKLGYYGLRADELMNGREPFMAAPDQLGLESPNGAIIKERSDAAAWIKLTLSLPADTDLMQPGYLQDDLHFQQGLEFWNLGYYEQAKAEFDVLIVANKDDPANLFRLGNYLLDIGHTKAGITALRDCLTALGYDDHFKSTNVPVYFNHARYGLYYIGLVVKESDKYGFDPLLLLSIMRQESLFEGFIHSSAGARGVMQIMPSTGESIAKQMGWPADFNPDMLYQPNISIGLGAYYLNQNLNYLGNDTPAALAGYNAGPGNASIWKDLAGDDPDLFVEVIRYGETRDYVRSIFETYRMYQKLYTANQ